MPKFKAGALTQKALTGFGREYESTKKKATAYKAVVNADGLYVIKTKRTSFMASLKASLGT